MQTLKEHSSSPSPLNPPDIKAKIVSHRLLVQCIYRIKNKIQETRTFGSIREKINDLYGKGCPHTHDSLATLCECAVLDLMPSDLSNIKLKCIDCQEPRYCDDCSTDFRVKATGNSKTDEISLTVTIWKDLGPRRTHCNHPRSEHPANTHSQCQNYYNETTHSGKETRPDLAAVFGSGTFPVKIRAKRPTERRPLREVRRDTRWRALADLYVPIPRSLRASAYGGAMLGLHFLPQSRVSLTGWPDYSIERNRHSDPQNA